VANFVFNIAKGRVAEYYNRVENNDPSTSALIVIVLASSGLEAQGTLEDADTFAAVVSGATNEVTGTGWDRKTLTDTELAAFPAPDDTNNRYAVAIPTFNWTPNAAADDAGALVICYDANTGAGTDTDLVPLTHHDFSVSTDGNQVVVNAGDFFRAT
jgi:hypothetical protein